MTRDKDLKYSDYYRGEYAADSGGWAIAELYRDWLIAKMSVLGTERQIGVELNDRDVGPWSPRPCWEGLSLSACICEQLRNSLPQPAFCRSTTTDMNLLQSSWERLQEQEENSSTSSDSYWWTAVPIKPPSNQTKSKTPQLPQSYWLLFDWVVHYIFYPCESLDDAARGVYARQGESLLTDTAKFSHWEKLLSP